jgi:hypothetical protein
MRLWYYGARALPAQPAGAVAAREAGPGFTGGRSASPLPPSEGHGAIMTVPWEIHVTRLASYKVAHSDCNVPWG